MAKISVFIRAFSLVKISFLALVLKQEILGRLLNASSL
jgi:hypothetical protein